MLKDVFKVLTVFVLGILGGIFGSQFLLPLFVGTSFFYPPNSSSTPVYVINKTQKIYIEENRALVDALERTKGAVIGIETQTKRGKRLNGSGLILTSDGMAVSLAQLFPKGGVSTLYFKGKKVKYQLLKRDTKRDLVLVQLKGDDFPTVGFAQPSRVKLGERVFLVGVDFREKKPAYFANEGILRYLGEDEFETNIVEKKALGSVLFDIKGNVLGLNYVDKSGRVSVISIEEIKKFALP